MAEIQHYVGIKGSVADVYAALATIDGLKRWWSSDTSGRCEQGGTIQFRFGGGHGPDMLVTELKTNALVRWTCTAHQSDWIGTEFTFALSEKDGQVNLRFTQAKWPEATDFLAFCSTKWATFLLGLKESIESGTGRPWPHDLQISHS